MTETQKAYNRRIEEGWLEKYLQDPGIDIGCGNDLVSESFRRWDLIHGDTDAQKMEGVADEFYLTVYASHILEHLDDPMEALHNWYRILKPGGYLIVIVPHRDLYEQKEDLPSKRSSEHKSFWLPDSDGVETWSLRDAVRCSLPPEGWEIEVLRTLDTQYKSNFPEHPLGEYSIEVIVKKKMIEQPIHKALVTELLPPWKDKRFSVHNSHIANHLKEAEMEVDNVAGEVMILWDLEGRVKSQVSDLMHPPQYLIFDYQNPIDNEWATRLFRKQGYELHTEMTKRVRELNWGCKVMEKVKEPLKNLVTVVVPTYNSAPYLNECLKSILEQSHKNLEIILIDDASTDHTIGLARRLFNGDQRFHSIIPLQTHIPAGAVRQRGVDEAVGDFVCCFDSDDVMPYNYLEKAVEAFEEGIGFVYPRSWWLIPENYWWEVNALSESEAMEPITCPEIEPTWRGVVCRDEGLLLFQNAEDWEEASKLGSCMIMPSVCRNSPNLVQRFDPDLSRLQDWDMHLDLRSRGIKGKGFTCSPYIRNRVGSITNSVSRKSYEHCRDVVIKKHSLPQIPKTLILPLNSNGDPESVLAGPRIRGHRVAPHLPNAEVGDLNTLRNRWKEFDAFYFVCAPTPAVTGWVSLLAGAGKKILFDVCVEYWSDDYQFEGYSKKDFLESIQRLAGCGVNFICSSEALKESLGWEMDHTHIEVVEDSVMPSLNIKESYESTGLVSWCGAFGNIAPLLAHTNELARFTEETGATVRLITDQMPLRLPFRWEWKEWSVETEEQLITETDIYLLPQMGHSSFNCKGGGKMALACSLGMPIIMSVDYDTMVELFLSEKVRKDLGKANLQTALSEYITPLMVQKLIKILQ